MVYVGYVGIALAYITYESIMANIISTMWYMGVLWGILGVLWVKLDTLGVLWHILQLRIIW